VTPDRLFTFLTAFKTYLNEKQYLLDLNIKGEHTDNIIVKIQEIKDDLVQMIDELYDMEDALIPY